MQLISTLNGISRTAWKHATAIAIALATLAISSTVPAQSPPNTPPPSAYLPIPNYTGVGAGIQFRKAINDRLSGAQPVAPLVVGPAFSNLPAEQDGMLLYCRDCKRAAPCVAGGSGAWALGARGQWMCAGPALEASLNAGGNKVTNLANGTAAGDALPFGQSSGGDLGGALPNPTVQTVLGGKSPVYFSQVGPQFGAYMQPTIVGFASAFNGSTSVTVNKPNGTQPGHLMIWSTAINGASLTVTPPSGWTAIRNDTNGSIAQASYYKIAGSSEPASYTFTLSSGGFGFAGIVTAANFNASNPIDGTSAVTTGTATSATVAAPPTTAPYDLNLVLYANGAIPNTLTPAGVQLWNATSNLAPGVFAYASATSSATVSGTNSCCGWIVAQVAVAPKIVNGAAAVRDQQMSFSGITATGAMAASNAANPVTGFGLDGCFNPVAYGADPTGNIDSSAAFNATTTAACAAQGKICIPPGSFQIASAPWLVMCASGVVPDIGGAGRSSTILQNTIGRATSRGGGPALVLAASNVVSSMGGAGLMASPLVGTGNAFFPTNNGGNLSGFDLNEALGNQPLNSKAQLDVRGVISTTNPAQFQCLSSSDGTATPTATGCNFVGPTGSYTCKGAYSICLGSDGKLYGSINTSTTGWTGPSSLHSASALSANTTYQVELSYDGSNVRLYHGVPNATMTMDAKVAQTGTVVQRVDETMLLDGKTDYWLLQRPQAFWQGLIDTFQISGVARCTSDSGCTATNAKFSGDSNTVLLENWTNVASLPEVGPEYTKGVANAPGFQTQSWMTLRNFGLGNPAGNFPSVGGFSILSGTVGVQAGAVAPQLRDMNVTSAYGYMLDQINDYSSSGEDIFGSASVVNWVDLGGLDQLTNFSFTCGAACTYGLGPYYSKGLLLPPGGNKWGMVFLGFGKLDTIDLDSENGGTNTAVLFTFMGNNAPAVLEIDDCLLSSYNAAPITLDSGPGAPIRSLIVRNTDLFHVDATRGPIVDTTNSSLMSQGIVFENNIYDNAYAPSGGNTYTGAGIAYQVIGEQTQKQTTLAATTSGNAVWAMPRQDSAAKSFTITLNAYLNNSGASQTIDFPSAFTTVNDVVTVGGSCAGLTTSLTTLTLPSTMGGTPLTGRCEVKGY